jgi:hypothetical protein
MEKKIVSMYVSLFFFILFSCNEDYEEMRDFPKVNTHKVLEINSDGATFHASIKLRNNPKIDKHGFVWSTTQGVPVVGRPDLNSEVSFPGSPANNTFSVRISAALEKGAEYNVRAFVTVNELVVYGDIIKFLSQGSVAPIVNDYNPKSGTWGDTINFTGKYFSTVPTQNVVRFNVSTANVVFASDTLIKVRVPSVLNGSEAEIRLSVAGNISNSVLKFAYPAISLSSVTPLLATFGDTLTIKGGHINPIKTHTIVSINNIEGEIVSLTPQQIRVLVPGYLNSRKSQIKVQSAGRSITFPEQLVLKDPIITGIDADTITRADQIIIIYGENFSPNPQNNKILYKNQHQAQILESSNRHIKLILPKQIITNQQLSESKDLELTLEILGFKINFGLYLNWIAPA